VLGRSVIVAHVGWVRHVWEPIRDLPAPVRDATIGAAILGVIGGVAGLLIGLSTYRGTAWFAVMELGMPAAYLGFLLGLVVGGLGHVVRRGTHR
jgi:hypothetical protein